MPQNSNLPYTNRMIERFLSFIKTQHLFLHEPVLLAVSGGVDSVVMCHLFHQSKLKFAIAHINFQLRAHDSFEDEAFVADLGKQLDVPCFITRFNTAGYAAEKKISIQMAARELRYAWLEEIKKENGFHFIATAHHQNDSIETVLLNIFRGTGIHGLHGIKPKQGKIIRPLLPFYKKEIETFAAAQGITFRQDHSNFETDYDRNKIRLEIIPLIEKFYPAFLHSFSENIEKWTDAGWLYEQEVILLKKRIMEQRGAEIFISIPRLTQIPAYPTLLYEVLKEFGYSSDQVASVAAAFNSNPGKVFYSATHRLLKDRKQLILSKISAETVSRILISENESRITMPLFTLNVEIANALSFTIPKDSSISCLDFESLEFPLLLRKWKKGDYFYPFGMKKKKKKISNYLVDRKISLHEKENIWVLESGNRIACIIGERIDERFKITTTSKKVMIITKTLHRH